MTTTAAAPQTPWRIPSGTIDFHTFDDLLTQVNPDGQSAHGPDATPAGKVAGLPTQPGAPKKLPSLDLARFLKSAVDAPSKRQRVQSSEQDNPKLLPSRENSLKRFAVQMFGESLVAEEDSPRPPLATTGNVDNKRAPRTPVTDMLAAASASDANAAKPPRTVTATVTAPIPPAHRRSKRASSSKRTPAKFESADVPAPQRVKLTPTSSAAAAGILPPLMAQSSIEDSLSDGSANRDVGFTFGELQNAASAPLPIGELDEASAADIVLRRRLQNRAASARHRQKIKEREYELDKIKSEMDALRAERDRYAREAELYEARCNSLEEQMSSQPERERQLQEQAMLYIVNKYWLRQKVRFPTLGTVVQSVMSLSLKAAEKKAGIMDIIAKAEAGTEAEEEAPAAEAEASAPAAGASAEAPAREPTREADEDKKAAAGGGIKPVKKEDADVDPAADFAHLEGVKAWGSVPSLPNLEEAMDLGVRSVGAAATAAVVEEGVVKVEEC